MTATCENEIGVGPKGPPLCGSSMRSDPIYLDLSISPTSTHFSYFKRRISYDYQCGAYEMPT